MLRCWGDRAAAADVVRGVVGSVISAEEYASGRFAALEVVCRPAASSRLFLHTAAPAAEPDLAYHAYPCERSSLDTRFRYAGEYAVFNARLRYT